MQIKSTIALLSLATIISSGIAVYLGENKFCSDGTDFVCVQSFDSFGIAMFPIVPLFVFSLITYFLPKRFFKAWYKFALVWTTLTIVGILFAPEYSGQLMYAITKGSVTYYMSVLFCVISTTILILTLFKKDK